LKKVTFWIICIFFLVINFIRLFVDTSFGQPVRDYFSDVPTPLKVLIALACIALLIYLFPYKPRKRQ